MLSYMARAVTSGVGGVVGVDSFFSQCLIQFFERGWPRTTQENSGIHVADDGIGMTAIR